MARQSRASRELLSVVTPGNVEVVRRLRPPLSLTDEQSREFQRVVNHQPADWFTPGNLAMLTQYCRHVIMCDRLAYQIEAALLDPEYPPSRLAALINAQRMETRVVATLMTQLRLTPQAVNPRHTSSRQAHETINPFYRKPAEED